MDTPLSSLLLDHAQEILLLVDPDSLLIAEADEAAFRQLGYLREQLIGRSITDIECALADVFFWEEVRSGGAPEVRDALGLYQRADGSSLHVKKSIFRFCDPREKRHWLLVRAENVEESLHAEEELARMASQLRATLEATADGILVLDRDGRIINMNRRFAALWELPTELLQHHDDQYLFAWIDGQMLNPVSLTGGLSAHEEGESACSLERVNGQVFDCKSRPARHGEQIIGRVISVTDVTERHRAEQALIAARDAANAASQAKGEFLAMMSHEIRTPMNGIIGMAQLLQMSDLPDDLREYVDTMRNSGEALLAIINDILDYSKIEARKLQLEHTRFSLPALLEDVRRLFSVRQREGGPDFSVSCAADVPAEVGGDPVRLRQILVNLIGNAFKFTESGEICVTVQLAMRRDAQALLRFSVRDTGIGIPADKLEHIFTPFEQADMSTTRRYGGTGLGLSICRMLSQMMGGEIGVSSQPGQGSEFWFSVLLDTGLQPVAAAAASEEALLLSPDTRVLIVEDNPVNRLVLSKLLLRLGITGPVFAGNGEEALVACKAQSFELVFMDTRMPVMDGLAASRALREAGEMMHIIGVSADAMTEDREQALASGMNDYITKPVSIDALKAAIARWATLATS